MGVNIFKYNIDEDKKKERLRVGERDRKEKGRYGIEIMLWKRPASRNLHDTNNSNSATAHVGCDAHQI